MRRPNNKDVVENHNKIDILKTRVKVLAEDQVHIQKELTEVNIQLGHLRDLIYRVGQLHCVHEGIAILKSGSNTFYELRPAYGGRTARIWNNVKDTTKWGLNFWERIPGQHLPYDHTVDIHIDSEQEAIDKALAWLIKDPKL